MTFLDGFVYFIAAIWFLGIITMTIAMPIAIREDPMISLITDINPSAVLMALTLIIVTWPLTIPVLLIQEKARG